MRGNIGQMMKQAQMMQENMRRMQEQLASMEVEGQAAAIFSSYMKIKI
jgi:DNA-binding protein YbaB